MARQDERATTLPGILPTIAAGFEVVTTHLWLILIPILLDVFYWIGPQLSSRTLILDLVEFLRQQNTATEMTNWLAEVAAHTNLFTVVSVPYLGVPGLMAGFIMPDQTPVVPIEWQVSQPFVWLLLFCGLLVIGLLMAAVYYSLISWAVRRAEGITVSVERFLWRLSVNCFRLFGLAVTLLFLVLAIYIPLMLFATFVSLLSPNIAMLVIFAGVALILWLLFYMSFSMHGILLRERPVLWALLDSIRLVQRYWLSALLLFLLILSIRNVLSWLWLWFDTGSWLTLASIAGYAFINTSLLAATFIFYRDRYNDILQNQQQLA